MKSWPDISKRWHVMLALSVVVAAAWSYIVYLCWKQEPFWTASALTALAVLVTTAVIVRQFLKQRSLKLVVLVAPLMIAIICLPLRKIVQGRLLRSHLRSVGAVEYQLQPEAGWQWCADIFGSSFHTQLVSLRLDLELVNPLTLEQLPDEGLKFLGLAKVGDRSFLDAPLVEWINGCPQLERVSISLNDPQTDELAVLEDLAKPTNLSLTAWETLDRSLELPMVSSLSVTDSLLPPQFTKHQLQLTDLTTLDLSQSLVEDPGFFHKYVPSRRIKVINCTLTLPCTTALLSIPCRHVSLMGVSVPASVQLPTNMHERLASARSRTLTLYECQVSGEKITDICAFRGINKLLVSGTNTLDPETTTALIQQPQMAHIILRDPEVGSQHLAALPNRQGRFVLELQDSTLPIEAELQLRASLNDTTELVVSRRSGQRMGVEPKTEQSWQP